VKYKAVIILTAPIANVNWLTPGGSTPMSKMNDGNVDITIVLQEAVGYFENRVRLLKYLVDLKSGAPLDYNAKYIKHIRCKECTFRPVGRGVDDIVWCIDGETMAPGKEHIVRVKGTEEPALMYGAFRRLEQ